MEMEYRRTWNRSYMILKEEVSEEGYELNMLKYNTINGLLPIQVLTENGAAYPSYEITGRKSLDSYLENQDAGVGIFQKILENLIHLCRELEKYLLDEDCLILNQELIFLDGENGKLYFCYHPEKRQDMKIGFRELIEELLTKLDHGKREETEVVYALYQRIQEENYSLLDLQELFFQREDKAVRREEWEESRGMIGEDETGYDLRLKLTHDPEYQSLDDSGSREICEADSKKKEKREHRSRRCLENLKNKWNPAGEKGISLPHMDKLKLERLRPERLKSEKQRPEKSKARGWKDTGSQRMSYQEEKILLEEEREESRSPEVYARLIYLGKGEERDFILDQPIFIIGRDEVSANGVLRSTAVGSVQAKVMRREDGYYIEDMNSANGTLVNGELLIYKSARKLVEGDRITFADISYRFLTFCHNSII